MTSEFVTIDDQLRIALTKIVQVLGCRLAQVEIDRAITDAEEDQVSAKSYEFLNSSRVRVSGEVDEYEAETMLLCVDGHRRLEANLADIVEHANLEAHRIDKEAGDT